jgi:hypothetical protein
MYSLNADTYKYKLSSGYQYSWVSPTNVAYSSGDMAAESDTAFTFVGAYLTGAWRHNLNVQVKGLLEGETIYDVTVVVSAYEPTWYEFDFSNIDRLEFSSWGGTQAWLYAGTHFAMDNFTFTPFTHEVIPEPSTVTDEVILDGGHLPEPSTMLLFGAGLIGLFVLGRKELLKK